MSKPLSKRTLYCVISVVISALVIYLITYNLVIQPLKMELASTKNSTAMFEAQLDKLASQANNKSDSISHTLAFIPNREQPDQLLLEMEQFASSSNVAVHLLELAAVENTKTTNLPEGIGKKSYTFEATTKKLEHANAFLSLLKNNKRLLTVDKIAINKSEKMVSFTVTFSVFHKID
ncbi:hypothetical protein CFK37_12865 [Virgibacillus phasianinus]|uniref:Pilus assembly protein PilO n=1 Tax=Virgibacillus phasianinus TaxID=2017483 RepID=A0A220U4E8_9BACI|nr:hypothetical protein [Virgibacillus phasianinus]ASK62970.1 hypothetical protein CFK37_12865 [Virgibacillus phasianinus]